MKDHAGVTMGSPHALVIPANLVAAAEREGRQGWLTRLPAAVRRLEAQWSLTIGQPFQPGGQTAWVAPARRRGESLVVKILWRHPEAEHEADGLSAWDGNGAVRLCAACEVDAETIALLLERCRPGTNLGVLGEPEQDVVVAELLQRIWINPPAGHQFRPLTSMCELWSQGFVHKTANPLPAGLDPGMAREGLALFRSLPIDAEREVLLCTDLHAGNILAAEREPWLLIDPKPYVGDPTYDALQHMLNCDRRLYDDPRRLTRRLADLLDLDADRLLLWLFARCIQESPEWPELAEVARMVAPQ